MQKIGPRRQRKPRKNSSKREVGIYTEAERMIVDDVVALIPKGYKALKNKLFKCKKKTTTTTTPFESHQPVQKLSSEDYHPVQILSPEYYQP